MLCQLPICQSNLELPGPEDKELVEIVVSTARVAIMPAVDQSDAMRAPAPMPTRIDDGVHRFFHSIEVSHLLSQQAVVRPDHMGIEGAEQNRNAGAYRMHRSCTEIIELRVEVGWHISGGGRIILHLLVTALHGICFTRGGILEIALIEDDTQIGLAHIQENPDTLFMVGPYRILENSTPQMTIATGQITQAEPTYAQIGSLSITLDAQDAGTDC